MTNITWRFYYLFIICNFTNAVFFWIFLPETAKRPLEEMNYLFENAPWVIVGVSRERYVSGDLERRVESIAREKGADLRVEKI